jgi:hypothetical protein
MFTNYYITERVARDMQNDRTRESTSRRRWLKAQRIANSNNKLDRIG